MNKLIIIVILLAALLLGVVLLSGKKTSAPAKSASAPVSETSMSKKPVIPAAPKTADQEKIIQNIRQELKAVMDLNQKINAVQTSKSAQLLRIEEQAAIHQKILADIQKSTSNSAATAVPTREALLAQEKLRIIREETLRNRKILEERSAPKAGS